MIKYIVLFETDYDEESGWSIDIIPVAFEASSIADLKVKLGAEAEQVVFVFTYDEWVNIVTRHSSIKGRGRSIYDGFTRVANGFDDRKHMNLTGEE